MPDVPNSAGTEAPKLKAPVGACDCHMHIYDGDRFPPARPGPQSRMQENAAVAQYRLLQQRLGTTRTVIVTPAAYVTDNRVTLDGIAQLGAANTRGVAVLHPDVTDTELRTLDDGRSSRHSLHGVRSALRRSIDRHDRAARKARRGSRLAHPDPHARRPDRGECRAARRTADASRVRSSRPPAAARAARARGVRHHPPHDGQGQSLDEAVGGLHGHEFRSAHLRRQGRGRAGVHQGRARARRVGLGLAAPDRKAGAQAGRRDAVRPARRLGAATPRSASAFW